ncbi:hypothetical protein GGF46_005117 [Coemansia sp. RSA 552]|nr:hypothetical protein GGF46_005117 [Coemansia sp. RSA 552]
MAGSQKRKGQVDEGSSDKCLLDIPSGDEVPASREESQQTIDGAGERKTFRVEPPSDLLSRLQAFLPQIAEANEKLETDVAKDPSKHDIENVGSDERQYIEMDLGLGVFDMKPKEESTDMEGVVIHGRNEGGSSDDDARDSHVVIDPSAIASRQRPKPHIEILGDSGESSSDDSSDSDMAS